MTSNIITQIIGGSVTPPATNHNDLGGLQGGASGEYFHLTQEEYIVLMEVVEGQDRLDVINGEGAIIPIGSAVQIQSVDIVTGQLTVESYDGNSGLYIGLAGENIAIATVGIVVIRGLVLGINTSNLVAGEPIYLDDISLSFTSDPLVSSLRIGFCISVGVNGDVHALPPTFTDQGPAVQWRGIWNPLNEYHIYDQVSDSGVLAIANQTTMERPSPQESGPPTYDLPDQPTWERISEANQFVGGHQYTLNQPGYVRSIESWTYVQSVAPPYRAIVLDVTNPALPISYPLPTFLGGQDEWSALQFSNTLFPAGTVLQVLLASLSSGGTTNWNAPYDYIDQNVQTPGPGQWSRDSQNTRFLINKTDSSFGDQSANLALMVPGAGFTIDNNSQSGQFVYIILGSTDNGSWIEFSVALSNGSGAFNPGNSTTVNGDYSSAPTADYVTIDDHWLGGANDPSWAAIRGVTISPAGLPGVLGDDAFGIRVNFQPVTFSNHWDIQSISNSSAPPPENVGFVLATHRSFTNQVPAADLTPETIIFEVPVNDIPELTMNVDGSFVFNTLGQSLGALTLTVGRAGAGPQESLWVWAERLVSTGPDVWAQVGTTLVRATTNATIDTSSFALNIINVQIGDTYRFRMEAEDASEFVGLYAEGAIGNHAAVTSCSINFQIYKGD